MSDTLSFKCPCCTAALNFSGATGELTCEYCGASFTIEQARAAQEAERQDAASSDMTWTSSAPALITDESGKVSGYRCNSCGAEMVADEKTAATECPYCGNNAIVAQSFEGMYRPDLVVPFTVDRKKAQDALRAFYRGKKLLPRTFTDSSRIDNITGLYVPFWLMSCHASGAGVFEGVKETRWEDAVNRYVKKDYYRVARHGEMDFNRIPVDASTKMDDATMDSLEPYDVSKGVAYDAAYFSGYLADRYDVEAAVAQPRASDRVEHTVTDKLQDEARKGYNSVERKSVSVRLSNTRTEYAMLPVWMLSTKFEGKIYSFAMNGQTGKVAGSLPIDMGLYRKYFASAAAIGAAILAALVFLFGGRTFHPIGTAIAVLVGILIGWIYAGSLKSSMNTIAQKHQAASYLNEAGMRISAAGLDPFLYSKTEKTAKSQPQQQQGQPPQSGQRPSQPNQRPSQPGQRPPQVGRPPQPGQRPPQVGRPPQHGPQNRGR